MVLCFGPDAADYRVELYDGYHADRPEVPDDLAPQFAACEEYFGAFGWTVAIHDTLEADDLLGSYASVEEAAGGEALLLTGDRDLYQCASERTTVLYVRTGGRGAEQVTPEEVRKRYGIDPEQVPDFIALRGDPSDGIPGAKGVGEKTAAELLRAARLARGGAGARDPRAPARRCARRSSTPSDQLLAYKDIATLRDAKVRRPRSKRTDWKGAAAAARERGMNRLADRLQKLGGQLRLGPTGSAVEGSRRRWRTDARGTGAPGRERGAGSPASAGRRRAHRRARAAREAARLPGAYRRGVRRREAAPPRVLSRAQPAAAAVFAVAAERTIARASRKVTRRPLSVSISFRRTQCTLSRAVSTGTSSKTGFSS